MSLTGARKYYTCSRTMLPMAALYAGGFAFGRAAYFATGHLGLTLGPLGELHRAFTAAPGLRVRAGDWMNWVPVALFGAFLLAELARQQGRRVGDKARLLLAAYSVGVTGGATVVAVQHAPESLGLGIAMVTAGLFAAARWQAWSRRLRAVALGVGVGAAGLAMLLLRLEDMVRLGRGGG